MRSALLGIVLWGLAVAPAWANDSLDGSQINSASGSRVKPEWDAQAVLAQSDQANDFYELIGASKRATETELGEICDRLDAYIQSSDLPQNIRTNKRQMVSQIRRVFSSPETRVTYDGIRRLLKKERAWKGSGFGLFQLERVHQFLESVAASLSPEEAQGFTRLDYLKLWSDFYRRLPNDQKFQRGRSHIESMDPLAEPGLVDLSSPATQAQVRSSLIRNIVTNLKLACAFSVASMFIGGAITYGVVKSRHEATFDQKVNEEVERRVGADGENRIKPVSAEPPALNAEEQALEKGALEDAGSGLKLK